MANKRMFDKAIIDTNDFMDLPISAKALYFLLGMEADDEGFVSPARTLRIYGGSEDDVKILTAKKFLISFENGVVVITQWKQNNWLDDRRTKPTQYQKEKQMLVLTDNKRYELSSGLALAEPVECSVVENRGEEITMPPEGDVEKLMNEKGPIRHDFQFIGLEIYEKTGAPANKKGECFRIAKKYPHLVNPSLSFCLDYPNKALKWKMFLWKLNTLIKNDKAD